MNSVYVCVYTQVHFPAIHLESAAVPKFTDLCRIAEQDSLTVDYLAFERINWERYFIIIDKKMNFS